MIISQPVPNSRGDTPGCDVLKFLFLSSKIGIFESCSVGIRGPGVVF